MSNDFSSAQRPFAIPALQWLKKLLETAKDMPRRKHVPTETSGQRLARLRKLRGYTQREFADLLKISQRVVAYYEAESDRPPAHLLPQIAQALQVSVDELLGVSAPSPAPATPRKTRLWRKLRQVEDLPVVDQKTVMSVIDGLVSKYKR